LPVATRFRLALLADLAAAPAAAEADPACPGDPFDTGGALYDVGSQFAVSAGG
jgi:hypothetical protein